jgi:hypothetical protein
MSVKKFFCSVESHEKISTELLKSWANNEAAAAGNADSCS